MFILGLVLFLIGFFFAVKILFVLGLIILIVGAVYFLLGYMNPRPGRRRLW